MSGTSFIPMGTWAPSTYYPYMAQVTYQGSSYWCITPHTSGATFDPTKWQLLAAAGTPGSALTWVGTWVPSTSYAANIGVTYNGSSYASLQTSNLNHQPDTSPTWWQLIAQAGTVGPAGPTGPTGPTGPAGPAGTPGAGIAWKGTYNAATTYAVNDGVATVAGNSYASLQNLNTGHDPATSPTYWQLIAQAGAVGPTGPPGATGATGPAGATGPSGATGPAGAAGPTGPKGPQGDPGLGGGNLGIQQTVPIGSASIYIDVRNLSLPISLLITAGGSDIIELSDITGISGSPPPDTDVRWNVVATPASGMYELVQPRSYIRIRRTSGSSSGSMYQISAADRTGGGTTPPGVVSGISAISSSTSLLWSWVAGSGAASYDVRTRLSGGTWSAVTNMTTTSYNQTGLTAATNYDIGITSRNSAGTSAEVTFTASTSAGITTNLRLVHPLPSNISETGTGPWNYAVSDNTVTYANAALNDGTTQLFAPPGVDGWVADQVRATDTPGDGNHVLGIQMQSVPTTANVLAQCWTGGLIGGFIDGGSWQGDFPAMMVATDWIVMRRTGLAIAIEQHPNANAPTFVGTPAHAATMSGSRGWKAIVQLELKTGTNGPLVSASWNQGMPTPINPPPGSPKFVWEIGQLGNQWVNGSPTAWWLDNLLGELIWDSSGTGNQYNTTDRMIHMLGTSGLLTDSLTQAAPWTIGGLVRIPSGAADSPFLLWSTSNASARPTISTNGINFSSDNLSFIAGTSAAVAYDTTFSYMFVCNGTSSAIYINGVSVVTGNAGSTGFSANQLEINGSSSAGSNLTTMNHGSFVIYPYAADATLAGQFNTWVRSV